LYRRAANWIDAFNVAGRHSDKVVLPPILSRVEQPHRVSCFGVYSVYAFGFIAITEGASPRQIFYVIDILDWR